MPSKKVQLKNCKQEQEGDTQRKIPTPTPNLLTDADSSTDNFCFPLI